MWSGPAAHRGKARCYRATGMNLGARRFPPRRGLNLHIQGHQVPVVCFGVHHARNNSGAKLPRKSMNQTSVSMFCGLKLTTLHITKRRSAGLRAAGVSSRVTYASSDLVAALADRLPFPFPPPAFLFPDSVGEGGVATGKHTGSDGGFGVLRCNCVLRVSYIVYPEVVVSICIAAR